MDELLPCPFCGSDEVKPTEDDFGNPVVMCENCYCCGPSIGKYKSDAIKYWNCRGKMIKGLDA